LRARIGIGPRTDSTFSPSTNNHKGSTVNWHLSLGPLIALIAGILILVVPRLLNFIVAIYLIIVGLLGLFGTGAIKI
jgi:hypothetical protein